MNVTSVAVGKLRENCYILEKDNKLLIIDPGDEFDKINEIINNRVVLGILITHEHFDHVGALGSFSNIDIYKYDNIKTNELHIGPFNFRVLETPGHTSDSVSYYFYEEDILFSGDFLFYHTVGRCDLPTGDFNMMIESINNIKKLPINTLVYPGHGKFTTLEEEINYNDYF